MPEVRLLSEEPEQRGLIRRIWPYLRPHRRLLAGAVTVNVLSTLTLTAVPAVIGRAVDAILDGDRDGLLRLGTVVLVLVTARMLLLRQAELLLVRAGERVVRDLRDLAVERISAAPLRFVEQHRGGDLLQRTTAEIAELATFVRAQLPDLISLAGYVAFSTGMLLFYSWPLALLLIAVFVPMMWLIANRFRRAAEPAYAAEATAQAGVTSAYRETLDAREQLQLAGGEAQWRARLAVATDGFHRAVRRTQVAVGWLEGAWIVQGVVTAVLLVVGGSMVAAGALTVGVVVTFLLASRELFSSVDDLTYVVGEMAESKAGLARLLDLLDATETPPRPTTRRSTAPDGTADDRDGTGTGSQDGTLTARGIGYRYLDGQPVLHEVTVEFAPGERVGLVGRTGSGKTTLAKILCGLYEPHDGSVRLGGVELAELPPAELRRRLVLIPQQVHMIDGTLADNLALAPGEPDRARFDQAVRTLELDDWVRSLPDGLDTDLGPRGGHLSAGERQLVGLIRAALVDPQVVILDEATADLDPATAARTETALARLHHDRTLIVIAHRPSTIEALPRVVRLDAGRLDTAGETVSSGESTCRS